MKDNPPDLLTDQSGLAQLRVAGKPLADEQLTQEGIQRFLFATKLLTPAAVLLVQGGEEPLEHEEGTLLGIGLLSGRHEDGRMFGPVGRILGKGSCRQDKRRSGQRREVTVEGGN